ncbi:S1C family serine protease [Chloroflexota bacterium]
MKRTNITSLVITAILMLVLTLSSGCALLNPDTETTPTSTSAPTNDTVDQIDSSWTPPTIESDAQVLPSIADVVAQVKPSVVAINTEVITYDFFNQPYTQEGAGSGWIIDSDGIIITNNHVIEGAESATITLDDGRIFSIDINTVATDPLTDLAILKIDAENLPAVSVGDSDKLRVGDWVVAIGNSLGERISATNGIISALEVALQVDSGQTLYDLVQTDAAINPGNSGGPLVNMAGEVIGITSIKIATVGVEGMGYAISIHTALPIIEDLVTIGYVIRPWLGVVLYTVDEGIATRFGLAVNQGTLLTEVSAGSPADKAGLEPGDVIVSFNSKEITNTNDLIQAIRTSRIGQKVEIIYLRGETKYTTNATLIESPPPP